MVLHASHLPATSDARYARRIRNAAVLALSPLRPPACSLCGAAQTLSRPASFLHIDHVQGTGGTWRSLHASRGEYRRIPTLTSEQRAEEFRLLCPDCHKNAPFTVLFRKAGEVAA
jgi:hypothetical protein